MMEGAFEGGWPRRPCGVTGFDLSVDACPESRIHLLPYWAMRSIRLIQNRVRLTEPEPIPPGDNKDHHKGAVIGFSALAQALRTASFPPPLSPTADQLSAYFSHSFVQY